MAALLVAKPGPLCDGLEAMLRMIPEIERTIQAHDVAPMLTAFEEHRPTLVLLDAGLFGDRAPEVVSALEVDGIQPRCLVLVDDVHQQRQLETAGADRVLIKGFPAAKLLWILHGLAHEDRSEKKGL